MHPNPIALDCAQVTTIDHDYAIIGVIWLDAFDGSSVLDIKLYTPSLDQVEAPVVPKWCSHWPASVETSGDFDWDSEFTF